MRNRILVCEGKEAVLKADARVGSTALVNLTSLRALDLSDNMVDSVLAIYRSLPALTLCVSSQCAHARPRMALAR